MLFKSLALVAAASLATAQDSICDKYTKALLTDNTAANQLTLLTYLVNTAIVGNFTPAPLGSKVKVTGIVNPGTYNGTDINLLPYFDGGLASSNRGGMPTAVNFLDDGGAAPLMALKPANGTSSNQYTLVTHLYSFFGALLGCSQYGMEGFAAYMGVASQYTVHKYMDLNPYQMGYFIQEVALAASSFGVTDEDLAMVGSALNTLFNYKCSPETTVIPSAGPLLQAMCIDASCPLAANATCSKYDAVLAPMVANETLADGQGVSSSVTLVASGASTGMPGPAATMTSAGAAAASSTTMTSNIALATAAPVGAVLAAAGLLLAL